MPRDPATDPQMFSLSCSRPASCTSQGFFNKTNHLLKEKAFLTFSFSISYVHVIIYDMLSTAPCLCSTVLPRSCPLWRGTVPAARTESWGYPAHPHHTGTGPLTHHCLSPSDHTAPPTPPGALWYICRGGVVRKGGRKGGQYQQKEKTYNPFIHGPYFRKQAQQTESNPDLWVGKLFPFQNDWSELAQSTLSRFSLREARSRQVQKAIISGVQMTRVTTAESRVKSRVTYFTPSEFEIAITT